MNRSRWYILVNFILLVAGIVAFFYASPRFRKTDRTKVISQDKEREFRKEVTLLDSLYRQQIAAMESNDQSAIANAEAVFEKQLVSMRKSYSGSTSPALLASKLIRNYQVRVLIQKHLLSKKQMQSSEINRIKTGVAKLEEQNTELKSQNQMIKQALLSLP